MIAHYQFCQNLNTGEIFHWVERSRKKYDIDLIPITVAEIDADALFIYKVSIEMVGFLSDSGIYAHGPK